MPKERTRQVAPQDKKIDEVLDFLKRELEKIKEEEWGNLSDSAREWGVTPKNISDFMTYGPQRDPSFRTTAKILMGVLGFDPFKGMSVKEMKSGKPRDRVKAKLALILRKVNEFSPEMIEIVEGTLDGLIVATKISSQSINGHPA